MSETIVFKGEPTICEEVSGDYESVRFYAPLILEEVISSDNPKALVAWGAEPSPRTDPMFWRKQAIVTAENTTDHLEASVLRRLAEDADPQYAGSIDRRFELIVIAVNYIVGGDKEELSLFERQARKTIRSRIRLAYLWLLGLGIFEINQERLRLERGMDIAIDSLETYCDSLIGGQSYSEAAHYVTKANTIGDLLAEGWVQWCNSLARGYVKIGESGKDFRLHYKGAKKGPTGRRYLIEVPRHSSKSTNYHVREYYKFKLDEYSESLCHHVWAASGVYPYEEESANYDARRIIQNFVKKDFY